jgi:hypothetical protein
MNPNYDVISKHCHVFRNYGDILDAWWSVDGIINHYAEHHDIFSKYNGINEFTLNIDFEIVKLKLLLLKFKSWTVVRSRYGLQGKDFCPKNFQGIHNFFICISLFTNKDMLFIGNFGLSYDQCRAQMALWTIWSSPLYMSNDLRNLRPEFKKILQNKALKQIKQNCCKSGYTRNYG